MFNNKLKKKHLGHPTLNYYQIIIIIKTQSSVYIHVASFKNGIVNKLTSKLSLPVLPVEITKVGNESYS